MKSAQSHIRILAAVFALSAFTSADALATTFSVLHTFFGGPEGTGPISGLTIGHDGNFYGTNCFGGFENNGVVFRMDQVGVVTPLHQFLGGADGQCPFGPVVQALDGSIYGTTYNFTVAAGQFQAGTIFRVGPSGDFSTVYRFRVLPDGTAPDGVNATGLTEGLDGLLYGVALGGGGPGVGTAFRFDPSGPSFTVLHNFDGVNYYPFGPLYADTDGYLYGTTVTGFDNAGTVFRMDTSGHVNTLFAFPSSQVNGSGVFGGVTRGSDGALYGTTFGGGPSGYQYGVVYRLATDGSCSVLHEFAYPDGATPYDSLLAAQDGNLYGTTFTGGDYGHGIVFEISTTGVFSIVHSFHAPGADDGGEPYYGALVQDASGVIYGTASAHFSQYGTIFALEGLPRDDQPPVITTQDIVAEATSAAGAVATYVVTATDNVDGSDPVTCFRPSGSTFPLGPSTVNCSATDGAGNIGYASFTVTVRDTTPPTIVSVAPSTGMLWPPNHKMVPITVMVTSTDAVSASPSCLISGVSSNESPGAAGSGNTLSDWVVTGALTLTLRAERSGLGTGRVYTIAVTCSDAAGNRSTQSTVVVVPHDQGQ